MNVFCFVGKVAEMPELKEVSNGTKMTTVTLDVQRPFANSQGIYEVDRVSVEVWRGLAETICNVSKVGSWMSVKGRVAVYPYEKENKTYYNPIFISEKVDFIN